MRSQRLARWAQIARSARDLARDAPAVPAAAARGMTGLLRHTARRWPDRPALRALDGHDELDELTWAELDTAVDRFARRWQARGAGRGDAVALVMGNRVDGVVHQLALARLGAIAAPVGPERRGPPLTHVMRAIAPRWVVVDDDGRAALDSMAEAMPAEAIEGWADAMRGPAVDAIPDPILPLEETCLLLATSGTTGRPKAARLPHRRILMAGLAFQALGAHLTAEDVVYTPLPLSHASAQLAGLAAALWAGACLAFTPRFSTRRYWRDAITLGATVGLYVGETGRYLADAPPDPDARRHGMHTLMGNGLAADVWPRLSALSGIEHIVEFYGATEGNTVLINATDKVGSVGRPVVPALSRPRFGEGWIRPDMCLARYDIDRDALVRDARGRCVEAGVDEPGEMLVRITSLNPLHRFDGYRDAAASEAKIVRDVRRRGDRWFRTGDLLKRDADGDWFFVDRIGDTFRWKGHNVSTQAVSEALAPALGAPFAVYGVALPRREGRAGMLAVAETPDLDAIRRQIATLPAYARPLFVRQVSTIEHTGTQKVQRARLRGEGLQTDDPIWVLGDDGYAPLTDAIREAIAAGTWR